MPDLLFSFTGACSAPIRAKIFSLQFQRQDIHVAETKSIFGDLIVRQDPSPELARYADLAARSKFILCPRGNGPSSYRLYEAMCLGRVPVIIADAWLPPAGPNWDDCSIQIPERHVSSMEQIIVEHEQYAEEMGGKARKAWEENFCPERSFQTLFDQAERLVAELSLTGPNLFVESLRQWTRYAVWWNGNRIRRHIQKYVRKIIRIGSLSTR